uniref:sterile alpha motif domain-containing protein 3-like isoform X1 n=2 Tax=Scatophagus argus TaxID=75038 RepID=UPI001ED8174F|nr:sterile alpha motif domain-containing protein 3-like isoform X1 [Scatophagus argus]
MAQYTMYPSGEDYVKVAKALVTKYPFLKDIEGNGYHTWHMSLKRKFKTERSPLVDEEEVKQFKAKFGHRKGKSKEAPTQTTCERRREMRNESEEGPIGEDAVSIDAHVKVLQMQYERTQPDRTIVEEKMRRTFLWRRRELQQDGMSAVEAIRKYPFLKTPCGLYQEMGRICKITDLSQRFRESFRSLVPSVLKAVHGKSCLEKEYLEARAKVTSEEVDDLEFRAALVLLPTIFKEKLDNYIALNDGDPATPYPTVQVAGTSNWRRVFSERRLPVNIKVDGTEFCSAVGVEDGILSAFCMYFVYYLQYPSHNKNTLLFMQRHVLKVTDPADKPLPTAVVRAINLLA